MSNQSRYHLGEVAILRYFTHYLEYPQHSDPEEARRAKALHVITLMLIGGSILYLLFMLLDLPSTAPMIPVQILAILCFGLAFFINQGGQRVAATWFVLVFLIAYMSGNIYFLGGTEGAGYLGLLFVLITASMIVERRYIVLLTGLMLLTAVILLALELGGALPEPLFPISPFLIWIGYFLSMIVIAVWLVYFVGQIEAALANARDNEAAILAQNQELAKQSSALSLALKEKEAATREKELAEAERQEMEQLRRLGNLAGGVASEFNSLLVGVLGHIMLADQLGDPGSNVNGHLEKAARAARRAAQLTRELLVYSGGGHFDEQQINVNGFLQERWPAMEQGLPEAVVLRQTLAPDVPLIEADPGELLQAVQLLIANAVRAGATDIRIGTHECVVQDVGGIWVNTGARPAPGPYVCLTVADNRPGFDPTAVRRLFDPFASVSRPGEGLGLAALLGIMRGHRGGLQVVRHADGETRFAMHLPLATKEAVASTEAVVGDSDRELVFVVDDEAAVREFIDDALSMEGWSVVGAADGEEGIAKFRELYPQIRLVLLDLTLPGMVGTDVWAELRKIDPEVRVILTSGYLAERALRDFDQKGLVGFLQKPYEVGEFLTMMREFLGRPDA